VIPIAKDPLLSWLHWNIISKWTKHLIHNIMWSVMHYNNMTQCAYNAYIEVLQKHSVIYAHIR